jgi:neutral ceramidase
MSIFIERRSDMFRFPSLNTVFLLMASCLLAVGSSPGQAAETNSLRAGAAKVDITPKDLTGLVSVWAKPFTGVHDPIFARAIVIDNGVVSAAIVSLDLVEFGDTTALRQRIQRELGIPPEHIMISATHDHNAPRGGPITPGTSSAQGRPYSPPAYIQFVDDAIVQAVKNAKAALQPARVGVGSGRSDINVNRAGYDGKRWGATDPDGPSDKTVWVVKFETPSGDPIALLMNYAVHSIVAGPGNSLVTGDLAGAAERFVERSYDDKVVALWTMGPAGDQNPKVNMSVERDGVNKDPVRNLALAYEVMDAEGLIVGAEVLQTANRMQRMTSDAHIVAAERVLSCAATPDRPRPANANAPMTNPNFKENIPWPASMNIHLNLIQIKQIAITGVSGEVYTRIYWHLKKDSPLADTIMVTMSNDRIGYIGDDAAYDGPISNPAVLRGCAENGIVNGLVDLMNQNK